MKVNSEKPAILCGVDTARKGDTPTDLREVLYGIEEEQIPYESTEIPESDTIKRAYEAAESSRLSVGLAFDQEKVVVHYRDLAEDQPLFITNRTDGQAMLRQLGNNAARLVKGVPFKNDKDKIGGS